MESLNWKQSVYRDDSIKKTNIREYSPHTGTNLNDAYSDIHIERLTTMLLKSPIKWTKMN